MKRVTLLLLSAVMIFNGCRKETRPQNTAHGILTGYDMATCAVCGGIKIVIDNDTTKNPPSFYRINGTLSNFGIPESTAFPINVNLDWRKDTSALKAGNYIIVSNISIRR